jgi:4-carboxymuconolactone decarboxylase
LAGYKIAASYQLSAFDFGDIVSPEEGNQETPQDDVKDLDQAALDFRQHYYGPDNNPVPPAAMAELAPEVMRLVDSVIYGEIYNRPAVDLKTRSLCTIAALVVLGHSPQMIKRHISGALHVGVTREEISEIIAQMVFYGGMPAAVNAFRMAKEAFDESPDGLDLNAKRAPAPPPPNTVDYKSDDSAYGVAPQPDPPKEVEDVSKGPGQDEDEKPRLRAFEQPPITAERPPRRPSDLSRRERDEVGFHRDRQHGESHGRQSDQSRPSANRARPASGGRNQSPRDGRKVGGQSKGSRPGQRSGVHVPPGAKGRGSSGPGRKRNPGRGK